MKKTVNGLEVSILPDEIRAVLPTMHLSDHTSNCPLLWEGLQEGDNISSLVCCSRNKQSIVSYSQSLLTCLRVTDQLMKLCRKSVRLFQRRLVVFLNRSPLQTLTKKPTVRWALEEGMFAKDFSEISIGMQLVGWIKNIMPYGIFVEFPHGLVGLAPKSVS